MVQKSLFLTTLVTLNARTGAAAAAVTVAALTLTLILLSAMAAAAEEAEPPVEEQVTLRGRVVEIHAELQKSHALDVPPGVEPLYALKTADHFVYVLLKTRRSLALFMDPRLRERELILKGRRFLNTPLMEATFIQSVHEGQIHDVYYYCDICAIKALTPEICSCCREPVRLVEEPRNLTAE